MDATLSLLCGITLLILVLGDFFYTTISFGGEGIFTGKITSWMHSILLFIAKRTNKKVLNVSGLIQNLVLLVFWLLAVWLGLFLVFSSDPESIVNSQGKTASAMERFYFTGYIISTLGIGNFFPNSPVFEIIASGFSLLGFVMITTIMTYFISISSAVIEKRTLSEFIRNLGNSPSALVTHLIQSDPSLINTQITVVHTFINKHFKNHHAYPVLHYFNSTEADESFSINLSNLDEAISIILLSNGDKKITGKLEPLRQAISNLLEYFKNQYSIKSEKLPEIKLDNLNLPSGISLPPEAEEILFDRRLVLDNLMKNELFYWDDIYSSPVLDRNNLRSKKEIK